MSSFSTNTATRRGKKSRTEGTTFNALLAQGGTPEIMAFEYNQGMSGSVHVPRATETVIGNHMSKGLRIEGGMAGLHSRAPRNPDSREIILGRSGQTGPEPDDRVADPIYPISFSGPGHMQFMEPVRIPVIRGDVRVEGGFNFTWTRLQNTALDITPGTGDAYSVILQEHTVYKLGNTRYVSLKANFTSLTGTRSGRVYVEGFGSAFANGDPSLAVTILYGVATIEPNAVVTLRWDGSAGKWAFYQELRSAGQTSGFMTTDNFEGSAAVTIHGWFTAIT